VPPSVSMSGMSEVYALHEKYTLVCTVSGIPFPAVNWTWQPCIIASCSPQEDNWKNVNESRNIPQVIETVLYTANFNVQNCHVLQLRPNKFLVLLRLLVFWNGTVNYISFCRQWAST